MPSAVLVDAFDHPDHAIGKMIDALKEHRLRDLTLIIVTARQGDVPIDLKNYDWRI